MLPSHQTHFESQEHQVYMQGLLWMHDKERWDMLPHIWHGVF